MYTSMISPVLYAMGFSFHENSNIMELNMILYLITVFEDVTMDKQGKSLSCYVPSLVFTQLRITQEENICQNSVPIVINLMNAFCVYTRKH